MSGFRAAFPRQNWPGVDDDAVLGRIIASVSGQMDSTMVTAGYAAPIDTSAAGEQQAALEAYLESRCLDGVVAELGMGMSPPPDPVTAATARFISWTRRLIGHRHPVTRKRIPMPTDEDLPGISRTGSAIRQVAAYPIATQHQEVEGLSTAPQALARVGGLWVLAQADNEETLCRAVSIRLRVVGVFDVAYLGHGEVTIRDHSLGDPGERFWLSQEVAGRLTSVPPVSGLSQLILEVKDADTVILYSERRESI